MVPAAVLSPLGGFAVVDGFSLVDVFGFDETCPFVDGDVPWPVSPVEKAVADDPDVVVDAATQEAPDGIHRLAAIPAVRRGAANPDYSWKADRRAGAPVSNT